MPANWTIPAVCLLLLSMGSSYVGDDDVVYDYLYRKPTPHEGLRRIRWVLLRTFTSIYAGAVLTRAILNIPQGCCAIRAVGHDQAALLLLACVALVSLLIGILSNGIRRLRGRPTRPLLDPVVWRRSRGGPLTGGGE